MSSLGQGRSGAWPEAASRTTEARIQISAEVAEWITEALRESQDDKQKFHRASVMRLQQPYLADVRRDTALHESASHDYAAKGSKILELAQTAPAQFVSQNSAEQARMLKMLLSNCSFDRGSLSVAWVKPFDLLARGSETDWLGGRDSVLLAARAARRGMTGRRPSSQ